MPEYCLINGRGLSILIREEKLLMIEMFRATVRILRYYGTESCSGTFRWEGMVYSMQLHFLSCKTKQRMLDFNSTFTVVPLSTCQRRSLIQVGWGKLHVHWWFLIAILSDARKDTYWKTYYLLPEKKKSHVGSLLHIYQNCFPIWPTGIWILLTKITK